MTSCFGYLRVSTVRQGEGVSLQEQRTAIELCAEQRGLIISEWFEEKETASKAGRPIFNHMIKRLRGGHAEGLVVHKLDRSARNLHDWAVVSELMDANIVFHIASEPIDFTTRGGRMTADFLAVIAADFSRNQREETRKGLYGRLKQGLYPFKAPLGYLDTGRGQAKAPCPRKGPLIKDLYALYLGGQHSLRSVHLEMYRRGLRGHQGGQVSLHGIEKILNNTFYHGLITIERTGETFEGKHEPLVTKRQFAQLQQIKAGRCGPKVTRHGHRFQGVFRCGLCDGPMVPERQKTHVYYRCQKRHCPMTTMREDRIEVFVQKRLAELEITKQGRAELQTRWDAASAHTDMVRDRRSLAAQIEALETKSARMTDLLIDGTLDKAAYDEAKQAAVFELSQLRTRLELLPNPSELRQAQREYFDLFESLRQTYDASTPSDKRSFMDNVFARRHLIPGDVVLTKREWAGDFAEAVSQNVLKIPVG
jgi:DNA invertase Pin-like site-specific DNA recombinase